MKKLSLFVLILIGIISSFSVDARGGRGSRGSYRSSTRTYETHECIGYTRPRFGVGIYTGGFYHPYYYHPYYYGSTYGYGYGYGYSPGVVIASPSYYPTYHFERRRIRVWDPIQEVYIIEYRTVKVYD
jgi:hypothetical protein